MNQMKKDVLKIQNAVKEATFAITCQAECNGATSPVALIVEGIEAHSKDPDVIKQLKIASAVKYMKTVNPEIIVEAIGDGYPEACVAWVISVMWFAFSTRQGKEHEERWNTLFESWKGKYKTDYENINLRNKVLIRIGLPQEWIDKQTANKTKLLVKMVAFDRKSK